MTLSQACRIQADAIVITSQQIVAPGQIVVQRGRILEVTANTDHRPDVRKDNCVLLPGLINAHTHLEFSDMSQPIPSGRNFPEWIQSVLARRQHASDSKCSPSEAISLGLAESRAGGVVVLGDIVTQPWQPEYLEQPETSALRANHPAVYEHLDCNSPRVIAFVEQLGLSDTRRQLLSKWRDELLATHQDTWPKRLIALALSPHAPYSTTFTMCEQLSQIAAERHGLLAMHLLESPAEREWVDHGSGPMADMLAQFGVEGWRLPPEYVSQLCNRLSRARSALLIHGNYLTHTELNRVAQHNNLSLVYCPRTHDHFGHREYPLAAIEQRGIRWLLGTDSRSTNPDLDLWQEARRSLQLHNWLRPSQVIAAITDAPATALHIENDFGSLQTGRTAAINCLQLAGPIPKDRETLFEFMLQSEHGPRLIDQQ